MGSDDQLKLMSFKAHFAELQKRLRRCLFAMLIGMIISYIFSRELFSILARPLAEAWENSQSGPLQIHFSNPIEPFFTYLKVSVLGGVFIAAPVFFWQAWKFLAPGLYRNEKKYLMPFSMVSSLFFVGGATFGYFVVFPIGFRFFLGFLSKQANPLAQIISEDLGWDVAISNFDLKATLMMGEYFGLVWRLLLAFGVVFELPLLLFCLSLIGLVDYHKLWRWNPYFIIISFVLAAILTPPDVITQIFMAAPLIALYNLSIAIVWMVGRKAGAGNRDQQKELKSGR